MDRDTSYAERLGLAVAASIATILAWEAAARHSILDRRLQPMRAVIDDLERLYGPDAQPLNHPSDFADLVVRHGADQLRGRDVQLLQAAMIESAECDCALGEALDDLAAAREASGEAGRPNDERSLLAWVGVSKEQLLAAVAVTLHHRVPA